MSRPDLKIVIIFQFIREKNVSHGRRRNPTSIQVKCNLMKTNAEEILQKIIKNMVKKPQLVGGRRVGYYTRAIKERN